MSKTDAEYKRDQRQRDKEQGIVRKEIRIHESLWPQIRKYIERLMERGKVTYIQCDLDGYCKRCGMRIGETHEPNCPKRKK